MSPRRRPGWHIWTHPNLIGLDLMGDCDPKTAFTIVTEFRRGQTDQEDAASSGEAAAMLLFNASDVGRGTSPPRGANDAVFQALVAFHDGPYTPLLLVAVAQSEKRLMKMLRDGVEVVDPRVGHPVIVPIPDEA